MTGLACRRVSLTAVCSRGSCVCSGVAAVDRGARSTAATPEQTQLPREHTAVRLTRRQASPVIRGLENVERHDQAPHNDVDRADTRSTVTTWNSSAKEDAEP